MTGERVLVIIPSRGRPGRLMDSLGELLATSGPGTHVAVACDEDDPQAGAYAELAALVREAWPGRTFWHRGRRRTMAGWTNHLAVWPRAARYPYLASLGDDHVPRTQGWDAMLVAALDPHDGEGIAYGDDGHQHENMPTAPLISRGIIDALGWLVLPGTASKFMDNAWRDLGDLAGCLRYVPEVVIEHVHPDAGKASWDETYGAGHANWADDEHAYLTWVTSGQRDADVRRVKGVVYHAQAVRVP